MRMLRYLETLAVTAVVAWLVIVVFYALCAIFNMLRIIWAWL